MPEKIEFIKFKAIKDYINDILEMRSSDKAVKKSMSGFDSAIEAVLKQAGELAEENKRSTVMEEDIFSALEKKLSRNLTWQETAQEIINRNPADLGNISKVINDYVKKEQNQQ